MKLEQLPIEVLEQILANQFAWAAIELWKCGNGALNSKLARGAITNMTLLDTVGYGPGRWPRCIKHFRLKTLSISRPTGLCTDYLLLQQVRKLHKDLKHLSITAQNAPRALFAKASSQEVDYVNYRSDDSGDENFEDLSADNKWNISKRFNLESLEVSGSYSDQKTLAPDFFQFLPRSLTHLKIGNVKLRIKDPKVFGQLPPQLKSLELPLDTIDEDALAYLPSTLTQITSSLTLAAHLILFGEPSLFPNLVDFPTRDEERVPQEMIEATLMDSTLPWPTRMRSMTLANIDSSLLTFPPNLTSITFVASFGFDLFGERLRTAFPRTLTSIHGANIDWKDIELLDWPPQLTSLMSYGGAHFGPHVFSKLPRSLKIANVTGRSLGSVSSTLRDSMFLKRQGLELLESLDANRWKLAKEKLINEVTPQTVARVNAYIEAVETGGLYGLPLGLIELKISGMASLETIDFLWPPQLGFANLSDSSVSLSENYFELLPPSITFISLLDTASIAELPSNLQIFDLFIPDHKFTTKHFKSLPTSLIEFTLTCASITAKEGWTHLIPRTLTRLGVKGGAIAGAELAKLPPKLTRLECSTTDVQLLQVRKMPRSLRIALVSSIDKNPPKDKLSSASWRSLRETYVPFFRFWEASKNEVKGVVKKVGSPWWTTTNAAPPIRDIDPVIKARYARE